MQEGHLGPWVLMAAGRGGSLRVGGSLCRSPAGPGPGQQLPSELCASFSGPRLSRAHNSVGAWGLAWRVCLQPVSCSSLHLAQVCTHTHAHTQVPTLTLPLPKRPSSLRATAPVTFHGLPDGNLWMWSRVPTTPEQRSCPFARPGLGPVSGVCLGGS